ncbi:MAG: epoxyqueuosine reductase QueH [bacterium]
MSSLLLHVCCGPCATHAIDVLKPCYRLVGCFHNPNIHPGPEYFRRLEAAVIVCRASSIPIWTTLYDPAPWLDAVRGAEQEREGGGRCEICFRQRLEATAEIARLGRFDLFATTLTLSPHKDAGKINSIGEEVASLFSVSYLPSDFKKEHGFHKSIEASRGLGLYRQRYCGCRFSHPDARGDR